MLDKQSPANFRGLWVISNTYKHDSSVESIISGLYIYMLDTTETTSHTMYNLIINRFISIYI